MGRLEPPSFLGRDALELMACHICFRGEMILHSTDTTRPFLLNVHRVRSALVSLASQEDRQFADRLA